MGLRAADPGAGPRQPPIGQRRQGRAQRQLLQGLDPGHGRPGRCRDEGSGRAPKAAKTTKAAKATKDGGRTRKAAAGGAAKAPAGSEGGSERGRRRRGPTKPGDPLNDLLPFVDFVSAHPVGTMVEAEVESFSSHGAYALVGDVRCYIPLKSMGDPPPLRARDVLSVGESTMFVVDSIDAPRRGIDLSLSPDDKIASCVTPSATRCSDRNHRASHRSGDVCESLHKRGCHCYTFTSKPSRRGGAGDTSKEGCGQKGREESSRSSSDSEEGTRPQDHRQKAPARKRVAKKAPAKRAPARKTAAKKAPACTSASPRRHRLARRQPRRHRVASASRQEGSGAHKRVAKKAPRAEARRQEGHGDPQARRQEGSGS